MTPQRIQRRRTKGWRMPPNTTVYVGRGSMYGNPYPVCPRRSARQAARAYRMGVRGRWSALAKLEGHTPLTLLGVIAHFQRIRRHLHELRGKNVCCWCRLDQECHGDVLLELANAPEARPQTGGVRR